MECTAGTGTRAARVALVLLLCSVLVEPARSFDIERSEARYVRKHYEYELVALLDAPVDRVETILRDYTSYTALDPRILAARVLGRPNDYSLWLETIVRACMGPFCRNVTRIELVEESPLALVATADAARSDVKFGETKVMLSVSDGRTRVSYRTSIVPDFWVPPFPGRRWMLETLEDSTIDLFRGIEKRAREENPQADVDSHDRLWNAQPALRSQ